MIFFIASHFYERERKRERERERDVILLLSEEVTFLWICNTLQYTATHEYPQRSVETPSYYNTLQPNATHCNTLQHTGTHCNTLQHTATHCNTLQHTATHGYRTDPSIPHSARIEATKTVCVLNTMIKKRIKRIPTHPMSKRTWCDFIYTTLQHTAIDCNRLQQTATHLYTQEPLLEIISSFRGYTISHTHFVAQTCMIQKILEFVAVVFRWYSSWHWDASFVVILQTIASFKEFHDLKHFKKGELKIFHPCSVWHFLQIKYSECKFDEPFYTCAQRGKSRDGQWFDGCELADILVFNDVCFGAVPPLDIFKKLSRELAWYRRY